MMPSLDHALAHDGRGVEVSDVDAIAAVLLAITGDLAFVARIHIVHPQIVVPGQDGPAFVGSDQ
jgi:hypothetical protein